MKAYQEEIADLVRIVASDPGLIQGRGGNASFEEAGMLHVTASGVRLGDVGSAEDVVSLRAEGVRLMVKDPGLRELPVFERAKEASIRLAALSPPGANAPSIESFLHALMPWRYTLHVHPVSVNALTCMSGGESAALGALDPETFAWVPYRRPGYEVGCVLSDVLEEHRVRFGDMPRTALMQNHGLVVSDNTANDVVMVLRETVEMISNWFGPGADQVVQGDGAETIPAGLKEAALSIGDALGLSAMAAGNPVFKGLMTDDILRKILFSGVLTPDQAVYCGEVPLLIESDANGSVIRRKAGDFQSKLGYMPRYVFMHGLGTVFLGNDPDEARLRAEVLEGVTRSILMLLRRGTPSYMPHEEARALAGGE